MGNIVLRLSTGSASVTTNTNPANARGGKMSVDSGAIITEANNNLNNLFDNVTKAENYAGSVEYRCVFIHNDTAVVGETVSAMKIYIDSGSRASVQIALGSINADAPVIADEKDTTNVLAGLTFSSPSAASKLNIGDLDIGQYIPLWIRRTVNNVVGTGTVQDTIGLVIEGVE